MSLGMDRETDRPEVEDEAWRMEANSERLQAILNGWVARLESRSPLDQADGWLLSAEDVAVGRLVPVETSVVFRDTRLEVSRSAAESMLAEASVATRSSPAELLQMLERWREPLARLGEVHGKAKIAGIQRRKDQFETRVHLTLVGHDAENQVQLSSVWHCIWRENSGGRFRLERIVSEDYERVTADERQTFRDATEVVLGSEPSYRQQLSHGLDYWLDRFEMQFGIIPAGYHGIAVGDVNGDGLDDLYVPQAGGVVAGLPNRLFVQQQDGTLRDVSREAGVDWTVETHSGLLVDFDNDGDQDLVAATVFGLVFCENDGEGRFRERSVRLIPEAPPMSLAAADYDADGDLDVYACCYSQRATSPLMGRPVPYHDANNGGRNVLFRNDRSWRFRDVTQQTGLDQNNRRFSFAACWEDYDNDGDLDLYVANDYGRNNLYENAGGRFRDVAAERGVEDISAGMSAAWGDYNGDGWMDLYVSNMWSSAGNRVAYQRHFHAAVDEATRQTLQRHARGNSLFANPGSGGQKPFDDVSVESAVTLGRWAWCSQFADINNDGREDLYVANGFITQEDTGDL